MCVCVCAQSLVDLHSQYQTGSLTLPGTPSHTSSPSSPVRDQVFSRPLYVLCPTHGERTILSHTHSYIATYCIPLAFYARNIVTVGPRLVVEKYSMCVCVYDVSTDPDAFPRSQNWPITSGLQPTASQGQHPTSAAASPAASALPTPLQAGGGHGPYGGAAGAAGGAQAARGAADAAIHGGVGGAAQGAAAGLGPFAGGAAAAGSADQLPLPQSRIYKLSCQAFARPLLEPGKARVSPICRMY